MFWCVSLKERAECKYWAHRWWRGVPSQKKSSASIWRMAAVLSSSGLQLAVFILLGVYAGRLGDAHFHSGQALMIVGLLAGFALGLVSLALIVWKFLLGE